MTVKGHHRGHTIFGGESTQNWYYANDRKKCAHYECHQQKEGYDYCLGHISYAKFACCGHGGKQKKIYCMGR